MAVKTYIQSAITAVQTAITTMDGQAHGMHQQGDGTKQQAQKDIARLEQERSMHMSVIGRADSDSEKQILKQRVGGINKDIDAKKAQIAQIDAEIAHAQVRKDQLRRDLYNVQIELTRLAALPDIG